jgi:hypothetical protein
VAQILIAVLILTLMFPLPSRGESHSYLSARDPGALGGFLYQYDRELAPDRTAALRVMVFSAQLEAARQQYGGKINQIPATVMSDIQARNNQLGKDLIDAARTANGEYQFNQYLKDGIADLGGAAAAIAAGKNPVAQAIVKAAGKAGTGYIVSLVEKQVADGMQLDAQARYANSLAYNLLSPADVSALWIKCAPDARCAQAFDGMFASHMSNSSITDSFDNRMRRDSTMQKDREAVVMQKKVDEILSKMARAQSPGEANGILASELKKNNDEVANLVMSKIQAAKAEEEAALKENRQVQLSKVTFSPETIQDTAAAFELAKSLAFLTNDPKLGNAFAQGGSLVVNYMKVVSAYNSQQEGQKVDEFVMGASTIEFGIGIFQLIQAFSSDSGQSPEAQLAAMLQQISQQVQDLHKDMIQYFEQTNVRLDYIYDHLATKLDTIELEEDQIKATTAKTLWEIYKDKYGRYYSYDNKRLADLTQVTSDCLYTLDSQAAFEKCQKAFVDQVALYSLYRLSPSEYTSELRFADVGNSMFPYLHTLPALSALMGGDTAGINDMANPRDWSNVSIAYLQLLQKNKKKKWSRVKGDLDQLIAMGERIRQSIAGIAFQGEQNKLKIAQFDSVLDSYHDRLIAMLQLRSDLTKKDIYGRDPLAPLSQPVRADTFQSKFVSIEHPTGMQTCPDLPDSGFVINPANFTADINNTRGVVRDYVKEQAPMYWNRKTLDSLKLAFPHDPPVVLKMLPPQFVWAHLAGIGKLDVCIRTYRPTKFFESGFNVYTPWVRAHYDRLTFALEAQIDVRFTPGSELAKRLSIASDKPLLLRSIYNETTSQTPNYLAFLMDSPGGFHYPDCLAQWAKMYWEATSTDSGATAGAPVNKVAGTPFIDNFLASGAMYDDQASSAPLNKAIEDMFFSQKAVELAERKADLAASDQMHEAAPVYQGLLAASSIGLAQISNTSMSLDQLFGVGKLFSPRELIELMSTSKMSVQDAQDLVNARILDAKAYFAGADKFLAGLSVEDKQREPYALIYIDRTLERLRTYETLATTATLH